MSELKEKVLQRLIAMEKELVDQMPISTPWAMADAGSLAMLRVALRALQATREKIQGMED
jgi:hypothetical protein